MAREKRLTPIAEKTTVTYRYVLDRAWPGSGISAGLDAPLSSLPATVPPEVLSWSEGLKNLFCAAVARIYRVAGRAADADAVIAQVPIGVTKKRAPYPLPDSQIDAFEAAAERAPARDRALALLLLRSGMRSEELLKIRRSAAQAAVLGGDEGTLTFVRKGGKEQTLPSVRYNDLLRILLDIPARPKHENAALNAPREAWYVLGEVLAGKHASQKTRYNLLNRFIHKLWETAVPGSGYSPHKLRHAFATRARREGIPDYVIQTALGHASRASTDRYLHTSLEDVKRWLGRPRAE